MLRRDNLRSINAKVVAAAALALALLLAAAAAAFVETRRQETALQHISAATAAVNAQILPLVRHVAQIRFDIAQVQQWLTDISATRGEDGLTDGFDRAAAHAESFRHHLALARALAEDMPLAELVERLDEVDRSFGPYYDTGRQMANAYIGEGTAAGNVSMAAFDAAAETLTGRLAVALNGVEAASRQRSAALDAAVAEVSAASRALQRTLFWVGLGLLVLAAAATVLLSRGVVRPVDRLSAVMRRLATGERDLSVPFLDRRDELGQMAAAVAFFQVTAAENEALRRSQEQLRADGDAMLRDALRNMADTVETETRSAVETVAARSDDMRRHAVAMSGMAGCIADVSHDIAAALQQASNNAQSVAAATGELSVSTDRISQQVDTAATIAHRAVDRSESARESITALSRAVERIGEIARLIESFARATNLLALNATIEAARAGDAGRGFAVVANEVKSLATQTARSAGEIDVLLADVRGATEAAVETVAGVADAVAEISAVSASIAAAVEEQTVTTRAIASAGSQTSRAVHSVDTEMERAAAEAARGKQYAGEVEQGADRMRGDIDSLRDVLVRIVRLATTEVDRRQSQRHVLDVACTVEFGQGRETGTLHDISAGGAQVAGVADRAAGTRGRLQFSGCARPLPFVVRSCEHQRLHLAFNLDANEAGALAEALVAVAGREAPRAAA